MEASEIPVVQQVLQADERRGQLLEEEAELSAAILTAETEDNWSTEQWCTEELLYSTSILLRLVTVVLALCLSSRTDAVSRLTQVAEELDSCGADAAEGNVRRILAGLGSLMAFKPLRLCMHILHVAKHKF